MNNIDSNFSHWLSVHERVRRDIRRIVVLLAVVASIAIVEGFGHLQDLDETYQIAREFSLQLETEGPRQEAENLFKEICQNSTPDCERGRISVRLESIPEVGWEYGRFLSKSQPSGRFTAGGYELGYASFALLLLFVPVLLLLVACLRLQTTGRIAMMLRESAIEGGEIQQRLNSVFEERATQRLGERRWVYATTRILIILLLSLTPLVSYNAMQIKHRVNSSVEIDVQGNIWPLPDVGLDARTYQVPLDPGILDLSLVLFLTMTILGLLAWWSVIKQLRPEYHPGEGKERRRGLTWFRFRRQIPRSK